MAVTLHVAADDSAVEDVESREQRGGAVAFVDRASSSQRGPASSAAPAGCGRAPGFGSSHRPTERPHGRADRRRDQQCPMSIRRELRVGRQLEGANAMRRQSVRFEDALHRTQAHASRFRQHPTGPVEIASTRWRAERQIDHPLHDGGGKRLLAGLARLVAGEPVDTLGHELRLPSPDHGLRFAGAAQISAVPQPRPSPG